MDISGPSSVNESKLMRPPHQSSQMSLNAHLQSGTGNPALHSWPGIKKTYHILRRRVFVVVKLTHLATFL